MNKKVAIVSTVLCVTAIGGVTAKLTNDKYSWVNKVTDIFKKDKEINKVKVIEVGDDLFAYTLHLNLKGMYEKINKDGIDGCVRVFETSTSSKSETTNFELCKSEVTYSVEQFASGPFEYINLRDNGYSKNGFIFDYTDYQLKFDKTSLIFDDFEKYEVVSITEGYEEFITLTERGIE